VYVLQTSLFLLLVFLLQIEYSHGCMGPHVFQVTYTVQLVLTIGAVEG
jgi:hypothetical protein